MTCLYISSFSSKLFLRNGYNVNLFDTQKSQLQQAQSYISSELESMQAEGGPVASDIMKKLKVTENLKEAMEDVFYVQVSHRKRQLLDM